MICTLTPETKLTYGQICTIGITAFSTCNRYQIITCLRTDFRPHNTEFLASICARRFGGLKQLTCKLARLIRPFKIEFIISHSSDLLTHLRVEARM
jgi:hypothetical protein